MKKLRAWPIFIWERFNPLSHLIMIALFVLAHNKILALPFSLRTGLSFIFALLFFFKLRLYDEIKDYETDLIKNPTRPLPRGLLTKSDLEGGIFVLIVSELSLLTLIGLPAMIIGVFTIIYSLMMFKEFYIGKELRPHLTTYAVTHTFVTVFLTFTLAAIISTKPMGSILTELTLFSIANWALFNLFEFGRKTFATSEERYDVESYSKVWKRGGAVILSLSQLLVAVTIFMFIAPVSAYFFITVIALMAYASFFYLKKNTPSSAKYFRMISSLMIVLVYLGLFIKG